MSTPGTGTGICFDHAVLGVRDLSAATAALTSAGLRYAGGGEHIGRGTANSLFALAEGYLELLTVTDPDLARSHSTNRAQVADALDTHAALPLGFAFQVADVAAAGEALQKSGLRVEGPVPMSRRNPDGTVLTWRNLYVGTTQWRTLLPFLITWDAPHDLSDAEAPRLHRLELAEPGDPATSPSGGLPAAVHGYHQLGATQSAPDRLRLSGLDLVFTRPEGAAGEGLTRIQLAGGHRRGGLGGLEDFLTWTSPGHGSSHSS
ncbi:VOC family protein [Ruania zhangjianzhongii]|uniref:VOC family protein n=1 Tax=Ruania zhangjianzhongii TaxID=2603206 RepID=UPI0011CA4585|nr:VOC family protein [Ruania zhangjianzhongii]